MLPLRGPVLFGRPHGGHARLPGVLESRHNGKASDRDRALRLVSEGMVTGFFPSLEPSRPRR